MKIMIDADGCPVVDNTVRLAKSYGVQVIIVCDTAHEFRGRGAQVITVDKGADSADLRLVNLLEKGDIAVTQDHGLAALCLSKGARALDQNGMEYTLLNIDSLLEMRYTSKKLRQSGKRMKGPKKRTIDNDRAFEDALERIIKESLKTEG